jgi:hypothetical protein
VKKPDSSDPTQQAKRKQLQVQLHQLKEAHCFESILPFFAWARSASPYLETLSASSRAKTLAKMPSAAHRRAQAAKQMTKQTTKLASVSENSEMNQLADLSQELHPYHTWSPNRRITPYGGRCHRFQQLRRQTSGHAN